MLITLQPTEVALPHDTVFCTSASHDGKTGRIGLCCCEGTIKNGAFCHKNSSALLNLLNTEVDEGLFWQVVIWYVQLNDPNLIPVAAPSQLRSGFYCC